MAMEDLEYRRENITEYARPSSISESETTCSYTDESVIDCELPEMVIFLQKSHYQVVKDIGIDKGVPSQHKCLMKKCEFDRTGEFITNPQNTVASVSIGSKSSIDHDCNKEVFRQCCSKHLMMEGEGDIDTNVKVSIDGSAQNTINRKLLLIRDAENNHSHFQLPTRNGRRGEIISDQIPTNSMVSSSSRVIGDNLNTIESCFNCKAKNGSKIREFDSLKPKTSSRVEGQQIENLESPHGIEIMPRIEDGMTLESLMASSESFHVQHCRVESSSCLVGSLSGPLSCPGPISCSGSTSLRSDGSTTSARSFAFPALPAEWNGSPVRMAKADQRQFRKHQRWRRLLCCDF